MLLGCTTKARRPRGSAGGKRGRSGAPWVRGGAEPLRPDREGEGSEPVERISRSSRQLIDRISRSADLPAPAPWPTIRGTALGESTFVRRVGVHPAPDCSVSAGISALCTAIRSVAAPSASLSAAVSGASFHFFRTVAALTPAGSVNALCSATSWGLHADAVAVGVAVARDEVVVVRVDPAEADTRRALDEVREQVVVEGDLEVARSTTAVDALSLLPMRIVLSWSAKTFQEAVT